MTDWRHDDLQNNLAAHLASTGDRIIWQDMQLGPTGSARPDVYTIGKSYTKFRPMAYEIKISTSDFRRDVTAGKWQKYLEYACGVIFAVPQGLIKKEDVPATCGLIVRSESGWLNIKGPTLTPVKTLPRDAWMKLVIDGINRQDAAAKIRVINEWKVEREIRQKYGEELANLLRDLTRAKTVLQQEIERNEALRKAESDRWFEERQKARQKIEVEAGEIDSIRGDLCKLLQLDVQSSIHQIRYAAKDFAENLSRDAVVQKQRQSLERIRRSIANTLDSIDREKIGFFEDDQ